MYIYTYMCVCAYIIICIHAGIYCNDGMGRERGVFFPYDSDPIVTRSGGTLCPINLFNTEHIYVFKRGIRHIIVYIKLHV